MERLRRLITRNAPNVDVPSLPAVAISSIESTLPKASIQPSEPVVPTVILEGRGGEITAEVREQWEAAYLGKNFLGKREFIISLTPHDDPSKRVYGAVGVDWDVDIDIPVTDPTPQEELLTEAYLNATLFGEIDLDKYRGFATDEFKKDELLAFLNRSRAGVASDDVPTWFYNTFHVDHLEKYGSVYIGSHGGAGEYGYDYTVTISPLQRSLDSDRRDETAETSIQRANNYVQVVRESLPGIDITPLPVDEYLQDVQNTLRFLPRDWAA
jgi:hypothetical protein